MHMHIYGTYIWHLTACHTACLSSCLSVCLSPPSPSALIIALKSALSAQISAVSAVGVARRHVCIMQMQQTNHIQFDS